MEASSNRMSRMEWLLARKQGLGSSDMAAILGLSPYQSALHIYLAKVGEIPDVDTGPKAWGRRLEQVVAQAFGEERDKPVRETTAQIAWHPTLSCLFATCDFETDDDEGRPADLEIKTVGLFGDRWGEPGTDEVPEEILIQVQHQLACTGFQSAYLAALDMRRELRNYVIRRDERLIRLIEEAGLCFWERVIARKPPTPDWKDPHSLDAVRLLYSGVESASVQLPASAHELLAQYDRLRQDRKLAKDLMEGIQAQLLWLMGEADVGLTEAGGKITRRKVQRVGYTVQPTQFVDVRIKLPREAMDGNQCD